MIWEKVFQCYANVCCVISGNNAEITECQDWQCEIQGLTNLIDFCAQLTYSNAFLPTMQLIFALVILALIVLAVLNRRKQRKTWVAEERREEGGAWVDKRAGERGAYGSLDAEMEAERYALTRKGRINDLALALRSYAFEQVPHFHTLSDEQIKTFTAFARTRSAQLFDQIDALQAGRLPEPEAGAGVENGHTPALKKLIMNFCYEQFPGLFDLELEVIKHFDRLAGDMAGALAWQMK